MSGGWLLPERHAHPWSPILRPRVRINYRARGRVWRNGKTWYCEGRVGDLVVYTDNTNHWRTIFDGCNEAVAAFSFVVAAGHGITDSYDELVDRAVI